MGGDLTRSEGPLILDFAVIGEAAEPVLRSGASPGDSLWVTGELGAAAATIARLLRDEAPHPAGWDRFACPLPRIPEARWLQERGLLHAMIDLSDGLAGDAAHLANASQVAVLLDRASIPIHPSVLQETASEEDALHFALAGGEDYELCFAAADGEVESHAEAFEAEFGVSLTRVGRVEKADESGGGKVFWTRNAERGAPVTLSGFQHFGPSR